MLYGSPLFGGLQVAAAPQDAKVPLAAVDYFKDVRPILETRCYGCHGPKKQKADLRLDKKHSAFGEASDGLKVIRPGRSAESELFRRVTSDDPEVRMPPEEESLTPDQIGTLRTWIDRGAGLARQSVRQGARCRKSLGLPAAPPPVRADGPKHALGSEPDRPVHPRPPRGRGSLALDRGG